MIRDGSVSREHAELVVSDTGQALLTDKGSKNGVAVWENGAWNPQRQLALKRGAKLRIGEFEIAADRLLDAVAEAGNPDPKRIPRTPEKPRVIRRNPEDGSIVIE